MVSPVTATNTTSSTAAVDASALASATSSAKGLGQDAFLKLLVAQISHQDPLKPMDDTAFVAQLAQFSSLEQMIGVNSRLDNLAAQEQSTTNADMANLVGKSITLNGADISFDGTAKVPVSFTLGAAAETVQVAIADATGKTVKTIDAGAQTAGRVEIKWDGRDDAGMLQNKGDYIVSVTAKTKAGKAVDVSQETTDVLKAIDFTNGTTTLELSNGVTAPASRLLRVNGSSAEQK